MWIRGQFYHFHCPWISLTSNLALSTAQQCRTYPLHFPSMSRSALSTAQQCRTYPLHFPSMSRSALSTAQQCRTYPLHFPFISQSVLSVAGQTLSPSCFNQPWVLQDKKFQVHLDKQPPFICHTFPWVLQGRSVTVTFNSYRRLPLARQGRSVTVTFNSYHRLPLMRQGRSVTVTFNSYRRLPFLYKIPLCTRGIKKHYKFTPHHKLLIVCKPALKTVISDQFLLCVNQ